jgi:hypothetical protein
LFLKPFLYLFVLILLVSAGNILAQESSLSDSLNIAVPDSLNVSSEKDSVVVEKTKKKPAFTSRVKYKATDSVTFHISQQKAYMYNESQVNYEDIELKSYEIDFDMITKVVSGSGGKDSIGADMGLPVFKQGQETFDSRSLSYNFDSGKGIIHETKTQQGEGYMHATISKRYPDGHIDMGGGKYTTCDADHPHFYLALSKAKAIPGDQVVFGPAHMVLLDIPLPLVLPFGFFPQNNKKSVSGVLAPSIGMEVSKGLSLTNGGYYFALSDNFDATIRGDIYSTGTWRASLATRYMKRYKYTGNLNLTYGLTISGEKGYDRSELKQYDIQWTHTQDAKAHPSRNFSASVNYSSSSYDKEYNYTNPSQYYQNTKNSSISYQRSWPNTPFRLTANMNHSQHSSSEEITISFPTVSFSMDRIYPFRKEESSGKSKWYEDISLQYDANLQNTLVGKEGDLFSDKNIKNMKNGFQHRVPFSINFKAMKFVNITPSLNYNGVLYTSYVEKSYRTDEYQQGYVVTDTIHRMSYAHALSPSLSVSLNPKFYLTNQYGPNSRIEAIRTTISPTASISYVPDLSSLFDYYDTYVDNTGREHKYSKYEGGVFGTPSAPGQSGSVSVGLNGTVEMKVRSPRDTSGVSKKIKILDRIDARSSYNIFADSMKWSNISLSASTTIMGINFTVNGTVDPYKLTSAGTRVDQFGPRLTNVNFNTGISLPFQKKSDGTEKKEEEKKDVDGYSYFDVPWSLSISYSFGYSKPQFDGKFTQNLNLNGSITLTPKWALSFTTSYDFDAKKISQMNASIQRDLHCWTMSIDFAPFGPAKYFFFQINVKSAILQDLKYEKRKTQTDFSRNPW